MDADGNGANLKIWIEQELTEKTENCRNAESTQIILTTDEHGWTLIQYKQLTAKCEPHLPNAKGREFDSTKGF